MSTLSPCHRPQGCGCRCVSVPPNKPTHLHKPTLLIQSNPLSPYGAPCLPPDPPAGFFWLAPFSAACIAKGWMKTSWREQCQVRRDWVVVVGVPAPGGLCHMGLLCCRYLVQAGEVDRGLVTKPLDAFVRAVGGRSAAPGGGSVSAAAAALVHAPHQNGIPACLGVLWMCRAPKGSRHEGSGGRCVLLEDLPLCPRREQHWAAWWA